jgi:hypothetical protein
MKDNLWFVSTMLILFIMGIFTGLLISDAYYVSPQRVEAAKRESAIYDEMYALKDEWREEKRGLQKKIDAANDRVSVYRAQVTEEKLKRLDVLKRAIDYIEWERNK